MSNLKTDASDKEIHWINDRSSQREMDTTCIHCGGRNFPVAIYVNKEGEVMGYCCNLCPVDKTYKG